MCVSLRLWVVFSVPKKLKFITKSSWNNSNNNCCVSVNALWASSSASSSPSEPIRASVTWWVQTCGSILEVEEPLCVCLCVCASVCGSACYSVQTCCLSARHGICHVFVPHPLCCGLISWSCLCRRPGHHGSLTSTQTEYFPGSSRLPCRHPMAAPSTQPLPMRVRTPNLSSGVMKVRKTFFYMLIFTRNIESALKK